MQPLKLKREEEVTVSGNVLFLCKEEKSFQRSLSLTEKGNLGHGRLMGDTEGAEAMRSHASTRGLRPSSLPRLRAVPSQRAASGTPHSRPLSSCNAEPETSILVSRPQVPGGFGAPGAAVTNDHRLGQLNTRNVLPLY